MANPTRTDLEWLEEIRVLQQRIQTLEAADALKEKAAPPECGSRYRCIVEALEDAVCRWRPDTTLTFVNDHYCKLFGFTEDQCINRRWLDFVPEEERKSVADIYRHLAHTPRKFHFEHQIAAPDGTVRWYDWSDTPIFDDQGALLAFQSVGRDITERKKDLELLQIVQRQQEALLNNIPDAVWFKDRNGRIISVNQPYLQFTGLAKEDIIGKTVRDIWPMDLANRSDLTDQNVMTSGKRQLFEEKVTNREGHRLHLDIIKTPIFNEDGKVVGIVGIARNTTGWKEVEDALRQSEQTLLSVFMAAPVGL